MTRGRPRLQIAVDVLRTIDEGCNNPTKMMFTNNLSRDSMTRILDGLVNDGLVRIGGIRRGRHLRSGRSVTCKGRRVFEACRNLGVLLNWWFRVELG